MSDMWNLRGKRTSADIAVSLISHPFPVFVKKTNDKKKKGALGHLKADLAEIPRSVSGSLVFSWTPGRRKDPAL